MKETPDHPEHSPGKTRHFFKVLLPTYLQELPIPRTFARKFREEISDVALLKGPSGRVWHVGLKESDGIVYFLEGWKEFVESHSLCIGYLLVFRYDGNSQFNVLIFDRSACEKEYPCATENDKESCSNGGSCTPEKESDDSVEILGVSKAVDKAPDITRTRTRYKPPVLRSSLRLQSNAMKMKSNSEIMSKDNYNKKRKYISEERTQSEIQRSKSMKCVGSESLKQVELQDQQVKLQDHLPSSRKSGDIRFVQSNGKRLMQSVHKNVTNCSKKKTPREPTPVDLEAYSTGSSMSSSGELFSIKVENQHSDPNGLSSSSEDGGYVPEQEVGIKLVNGRGKRAYLAKQRELLESTKFKSKHPFFLAATKASNLRNCPCMQIPAYFIKEYLPFRPQSLTLEVSDGRKWQIRCCSRGNSKVLLMSSGWSGFLTECGLEEGDVCAFELVNIKDLVFKVTIYPVDEVMPLN